jgi:hypothetical protein
VKRWQLFGLILLATVALAIVLAVTVEAVL